MTTEAHAEWYASWGYSREWWSASDIHISEPALGNDFTVHHARAVDDPGWDEGLANQDLTDPQYNVRVGTFFDGARDWGVEFNFDHSKYTVVTGQTALITGTMNGQPVDAETLLTSKNFKYWLHNGANHVMLNAVRRIPLLGPLALLAKAGAGFMLPHAENTIMGNKNDEGEKRWSNVLGTRTGWWELNGWTVGAEAGARLDLFSPVYLELTWKEAYAELAGIPVYEGRADQKLMMEEAVLSLGYSFTAR